MNDLSFNIKNAKDFFVKLQEDYLDFLSDKTSSRVAINCALTCWHLTDWIYHQYYNQLSDSFPTLISYQEHLKNQCSSLQIMHDITNGSKHYLLTRHRPSISGTELNRGDFDNSFSRAFKISTLDVKHNNGEKSYFEDEIEMAMNFWTEYLRNTFSIII